MDRWIKAQTAATIFSAFYLIAKDLYAYFSKTANQCGGAHMNWVPLFLCALLLCISLAMYKEIWPFQKTGLVRKAGTGTVRVIKDHEGLYYYIVEGTTRSHIPDRPTFDYLGSYYGFSWRDAKPMSLDEMNLEFTIGRQLPSILAHCPKAS